MFMPKVFCNVLYLKVMTCGVSISIVKMLNTRIVETIDEVIFRWGCFRFDR